MTATQQRISNLLLAVAFVVVMLPGCGGRREGIENVSGQVTFRGQPVAKAVVGFTNKDKGIYTSAHVDDDGRYTVKRAQGLGLPPGEYQVTVSPYIPPAPLGTMVAPKQPERPDIPLKYRDAKTSNLTLMVAKGDNVFNIDMKP